ncbi:MAG TPA: S8 family peptidase [Polyangia bacterium]|nr:S8 family peptidase [Polyangia bacterium]
MRKSRLVSAWAPWGGFAAVVIGAAWLWHGTSAPRTAVKTAPQSMDSQAEAEGLLPTRLLVDFRDDVSPAAIAATGFNEVPLSAYTAQDRLYRIDFATADEAAAARAKLAADPDVESVDFDSLATIPPGEEMQEMAAAGNSMEAECSAAAHDGGGFPNDACFKYQWHLRQIGAPAAWKEANGKGAVVAVIDTGVTRVADLAKTNFVPGYNFVTNNADASDDHGHGTHVAGTIAQSTNNGLGVAGVAYGASIMPLKVLSARGSGSVGAIAQAIRWAADHGANVINMSLGGGMSVGTVSSAIKYAHGKGVVVVAAAGNDGRGRVSFPARNPGVIAVAATQFDEKTTFYSNWGPEVDIAAPGGNTRVDQNGDGKPDGVLQHTIVPTDITHTDYLWFMGTSMAAPHVAGVAALVVSAGVRRPEAVEQILLATARKPSGGSSTSEARIDDHYGAGIVDAASAVAKAREGRGAEEVGLGMAAGLLALALLRRRGVATTRLGWGALAAFLLGSSGLDLAWAVPLSWPHVHAVAAGISGGFTDLASGPLTATLVYSAIAPIALIVLLYGSRRLRPVLAGFGFGMAGALLFAAIGHTVSLRFIPDTLEPLWLAGQAAIAALFASACLRKA